MVFLDAAASSATAADRESVVGFRWHHNNMYAAKEKMTDKVG
jgi:hypothetical protein